MRVNVSHCYNCICNACTKRHCPFKDSRCSFCYSYDCKKIYDCDFFQNIHTTPKFYKVTRKRKANTDLISQKLDYIISVLGVDNPVLDYGGTYGVYTESEHLIHIGTKREVDLYVSEVGHAYKKLIIKPMRIKFN